VPGAGGPPGRPGRGGPAECLRPFGGPRHRRRPARPPRQPRLRQRPGLRQAARRRIRRPGGGIPPGRRLGPGGGRRLPPPPEYFDPSTAGEPGEQPPGGHCPTARRGPGRGGHRRHRGEKTLEFLHQGPGTGGLRPLSGRDYPHRRLRPHPPPGGGFSPELRPLALGRRRPGPLGRLPRLPQDRRQALLCLPPGRGPHHIPLLQKPHRPLPLGRPSKPHPHPAKHLLPLLRMEAALTPPQT